MKIIDNNYIISKIIEIHGDLYGFDKLVYKSYKDKVTLKCSIHGYFDIKVNNLISNKRGCQKCGVMKGHKSCLSNIDNFIEKSNKIHSNKYDYSKSIYINWKTPLVIVCNNHGEFIKTPNAHLSGQGCIGCKSLKRVKVIKEKKDPAINIKRHLDNFISQSNRLHMNKYDYSFVEYKKSNLKVKILCNKHGFFEQTPHHHKNGNECQRCSYENSIGRIKMNTSEFISMSKNRHGDYYNYSLSKYDGFRKKVKIICRKHGEFFQNARYHINGGGCPRCKCGGNGKGGPGSKGNNGYTSNEFYRICKINHNNKYSYHDDFSGVKNKIKVTCNEHGDFYQEAYHHMNLSGCTKCSTDLRKTTTGDFIKRSNEIHDNKYEYFIGGYNTLSMDKVLIKCKEHGFFEQTSETHLRGSGCTLCKTKSRGEVKIKNFLLENNIYFIREKTFDGCTNNKKLRFDFYLPEFNTLIEYDGKQHFKSIPYFGGEKTYVNTTKSDTIKNEYCIVNSIELIRIPYTQLKNITEILKKRIAENVKLQT